MTVITDVYAEFLLECRAAFDDLCRAVDAGEAPPGRSAKLVIELSPGMVDRVRFERIAAHAENDDG